MPHPATGTGPRSLETLIAALKADGATVTRAHGNGHYTALGDSGAYFTFPARALTPQETGAVWRKWKRRQRGAADDAAHAVRVAADRSPGLPVDPWAGLVPSPAQVRNMLSALTLVGNPQGPPAGLTTGHDTIESHVIEKGEPV